MIGHTAGLGDSESARFVEHLLITDARGLVRPLAFFDLAGENLLRTDALLRFLLGIDALVFVVDPPSPCPCPSSTRSAPRSTCASTGTATPRSPPPWTASPGPART